jgi:hypothetical protein
MKITDFTSWFFVRFGWTLHVYPVHLLGCLVFWAALSMLTPANRVSAFIFAFSSWFFLSWTLGFLALAYRAPGLAWAPMSLIAGVLTVGLFGICTAWSLATLGAPRDVDADATRFVRLGWVLLPAHVFHMIFTAIAES